MNSNTSVDINFAPELMLIPDMAPRMGKDPSWVVVRPAQPSFNAFQMLCEALESDQAATLPPRDLLDLVLGAAASSVSAQPAAPSPKRQDQVVIINALPEACLLDSGSLESSLLDSTNSHGQNFWQGLGAAAEATTYCDGVASLGSVYVKNLPPGAAHAEVSRARLPTRVLETAAHKLTAPHVYMMRRRRGVGFVNYMEHVSALRAIQGLHGARIADGRFMQVFLQAPRALRRAQAAAAKQQAEASPIDLLTSLAPHSLR